MRNNEQTVTGWRAWAAIPGEEGRRWLASCTPCLARTGDDALRPWARNWTSAEKVAECQAADHDAPYLACLCGVHAVAFSYLLETIVGFFSEWDLRPDDKHGIAPVIGRVTLSGRILPMDTGWRSERATIIDLVVPNRQVAESLAHYGVPISVGDVRVDHHDRLHIPQALRTPPADRAIQRVSA